jgi:hypothetical protein
MERKASFPTSLSTMGKEEGTAVIEEASPHSTRRISIQLHKMLRCPCGSEEAIGYPTLSSGCLLCRIVDMEFREFTFYEVA